MASVNAMVMRVRKLPLLVAIGIMAALGAVMLAREMSPDGEQPPECLNVAGQRGPLRCQLHRVPGRRDSVELVLSNEGKQSLRFWYTIFELKEHVTMVFRDSSGQITAQLPWRALSSYIPFFDEKTGEPGLGTHIKTLQPGGTERHLVQLDVLKGNGARKPSPGRYHLQAVFEYSDLHGLPEPAEIFARSVCLPVVVGESEVRVVR